MADAPPRRRGRPALPPDEQGVNASVWMRAKDYDRAAHLARHQGVSVSQYLRRALATGLRRRDDPADE